MAEARAYVMDMEGWRGAKEKRTVSAKCVRRKPQECDSSQWFPPRSDPCPSPQRADYSATYGLCLGPNNPPGDTGGCSRLLNAATLGASR